MIGSASNVARNLDRRPTSESLLTDHQDLGQDLQVYVSIDESVADGIDGGWLTEVAKSALEVALGSPEAVQMSLLITNDHTIQSLNAQFRGLDQVTDVLSFSAEHQGHWEGTDDGPNEPGEVQFVLPPDEPNPLGEVILSYPQVQRQAEEHCVTIKHELAHLIIHGVLHLTGHDHVEPEESSMMHSKESAVLESLKSTGGLLP